MAKVGLGKISQGKSVPWSEECWTSVQIHSFDIVEDDCLPLHVTAILSICNLTQTLLSVCLAVWLAVSWLAVPPGRLHHFPLYLPLSQ